MNRISTLLFTIASLASTAYADTEKWSASIIQGAQKIQSPTNIQLNKAPFKIVFTGPSDFGFAVLASVDCTELKSLTTTESISQAIRPTNLAAEGKADANRFLVVNSEGAIQTEDNTAHVWTEDPENDLHSFQSVKVDARKQMIASREIREIVQYTNHKDSTTFPVTAYPRETLCLLITGLPPIGRMIHDAPKLISVRFK